MENPKHHPRTEAQQAASRANGRKSHGPVTETGKRRSSQNANKHGLLAGTLMLDLESRPHFDALLNSLMATFKPQDAAEHLHLETLAAARWRQTRVWSTQSAAINEEVRRQSADMADKDVPTRVMFAICALEEKGCSQRTLNLYEHRFELQQRHALKALLEIRNSKKGKNSKLDKRTWRFAELEEDSPAGQPRITQDEPALAAYKPELGHNEPAD